MYHLNCTIPKVYLFVQRIFHTEAVKYPLNFSNLLLQIHNLRSLFSDSHRTFLPSNFILFFFFSLYGYNPSFSTIFNGDWSSIKIFLLSQSKSRLCDVISCIKLVAPATVYSVLSASLHIHSLSLLFCYRCGASTLGCIK